MKRATLASVASVVAAVVVVAVVAAGCGDQSFCAKRQECDSKLNDDDEAVCVQTVDQGINMLRANHESECQELADAQLALFACSSGLSCSDFKDANLGGNCDDQKAQLKDAENAAGNLCNEDH